MAEVGVCRLCGANGPLSFEHVPPRSAFNDSPAFLQTLEEWTSEAEGGVRSGKLQQRGFGGYTLCERCNNVTGSWYGSEYVKWARTVAPWVLAKPPFATVARLYLNSVYPLRFLKQMMTCLFSANSHKFAAQYPHLVDFVLYKDKRGLAPRYEAYLTLVLGSLRVSGVPSKATVGKGDLSLRRIEVLTEFAHTPFACRLLLDCSAADEVGQITQFAGYGYGDEVDLCLVLPVGEIHTPFPGDYRTQDEIRRARAADDLP